ncbi:hypothetical protein POM88_028459 [Heracleum sosnowskyi]|uniref:Uncharacterized protein n=1 Tax=Heracleum sosnowskyi TaxID=360622 RepID=A0AAD8HSW3_9APIA|nr:hypothetical protein POM88_028459 [Heracleum sosnowskyi]
MQGFDFGALVLRAFVPAILLGESESKVNDQSAMTDEQPSAGQPELIALEKALRSTMVPTGSTREIDFGREVFLYEVEATTVEPEFSKLYSYLFDIESGGHPTEEMDRTTPSAIFIVNFDKRPVNQLPESKDGYFLILFWYWDECLKQRLPASRSW